MARTSWAVVEVVSKRESFIAEFAGSTPSAGRNSVPAVMFCVSAFKNRQPAIIWEHQAAANVGSGSLSDAELVALWVLHHHAVAEHIVLFAQQGRSRLRQPRNVPDHQSAALGWIAGARADLHI